MNVYAWVCAWVGVGGCGRASKWTRAFASLQQFARLAGTAGVAATTTAAASTHPSKPSVRAISRALLAPAAPHISWYVGCSVAVLKPRDTLMKRGSSSATRLSSAGRGGRVEQLGEGCKPPFRQAQ